MKIDVSLIYKVISWIKGLFWKNSNIIYVNSNKKNQSKDHIDEVTKTNNAQWVICQSNTKLGYKFYNSHLLKMKKHLWDILRNSKESNEITYAGFASTMFASFDGYVLGDNRKYKFVDVNSSSSKTYKVEYDKKYTKNVFDNKPTTETVNILFSCSYKISQPKDNNDFYEFDTLSGDKVTKAYLQDVYSYAKSIFDLCNTSGVKRINLFIAAKQPVSFVIGTAIQSYHPNIYAYEYENGHYTLSLNIQTGKLSDKDD